MFEGMFSRKPKETPKENILPPMTDEQRATALDHLEALKRGGNLKLTPEEQKDHEEAEEMRGKQTWN